MDKVKFSVFSYRALIGEKLKTLSQIDAMYNEQNKEVYQKLIDVGVLEPDLSKPVGIIEKPIDRPYTDQEMENNKSVLSKFAEACQKIGFVNTTLIDLNEFENLLLISLTDIAKCIEP